MEFSGQYLKYSEYQTLGGTLDEMPFNVLEFEARQNVDKYTFGRLKDLEEQTQEVKMCVYKLIEMINSYNEYESHNKGVASESTDGYSVSYSSPSLAFTECIPYMYCGVDK